MEFVEVCRVVQNTVLGECLMCTCKQFVSSSCWVDGIIKTIMSNHLLNSFQDLCIVFILSLYRLSIKEHSELCIDNCEFAFFFCWAQRKIKKKNLSKWIQPWEKWGPTIWQTPNRKQPEIDPAVVRNSDSPKLEIT